MDKYESAAISSI